jgi:hypothetical protein
VNARALRFLLPFVVAFGATQRIARTPESAPAQELSVRAAPDGSNAPESARTGGASGSEVAASNSRGPQRAARAAQHHACPAPFTPVVTSGRIPARSTGLASIPACARDLSIPFDATAPPRLT